MWIEELQNYMLAAAGTLPQERKKAILKACIGKQGRLAISNFQESKRATYDTLVGALKNHYKEVTNVIVERHIFHSMIQQETESIEEFETRLTSHSKKCNFTVPSIEIPAVPGTRNESGTPAIPVQFKDVSEKMIRDRIVVGMQNKSIQR